MNRRRRDSDSSDDWPEDWKLIPVSTYKNRRYGHYPAKWITREERRGNRYTFKIWTLDEDGEAQQMATHTYKLNTGSTDSSIDQIEEDLEDQYGLNPLKPIGMVPSGTADLLHPTAPSGTQTL